ncbi:hypothetical protein OSB04_011567 [Centaurea solstitialis]|uniref:Uncharacterized protein n=1 Tax=Centaurea solstitialis TaxID=347529 RepID=A0AA38TH86_9ASTR|nr:hypothetical protein OSB04_011567 [Centaurea solstitialis]
MDKSDKSNLKFGMFVTSDSNSQSSSSISKDEDSTSVQPPNNSKGKNLPNHPPKPKKQNHKTSKVLGGGPSGLGAKKSVQSPTPRLKVDLKTKPQEKTPIPPQTRDIGILGPGPAHLKFKNPKGPSKTKTYRRCYHCGQNDHIASKCPHATKAEKAAKVKKGPKANKSAKGKKPLVTETATIPDPVNTETSVKTEDVASTSTTLVVYEAPESSVTYVLDNSSFADQLTLPSLTKRGIWYLDSGCSKHMIGNKHVLVDYKEKPSPSVKFGGEGKGITREYDHKVSFSMKSCKVKNRHKKIILRGQRSHDVYVINMDTSTENVCFMSRASSEINWIWHKRLSHLKFKTINQLSISNLVKGLPENSFAKESLCAACEKGKQERASFKFKQVSTINSPLHLLHMDLFGPVNIQSMGGKRFTLVIVDEYSRYTWVFFLRAKSETPQLIIAFILRMEKYNQITVRSIRSDHGTEFKNSVLDEFLVSKGISQNFSTVRTPQQNGVAERRNRTLIEAARSMLIEARLPIQFWAEAVNTACYTQNRSLIVKRFKKTAYELFRGRKPNIKYFHIFGCNCYIKNASTVKKNFLNPVFAFIWTHFIQCLTAKVGSLDQAPFAITVMVWAAINNKPLNYAKYIYDDMLLRFKRTKREKNVAYPRFFSAIITDYLGATYPAATPGYSHSTIGGKALQHDITNITIQLQDVLVTDGGVPPPVAPPTAAAVKSKKPPTFKKKTTTTKPGLSLKRPGTSPPPKAKKAKLGNPTKDSNPSKDKSLGIFLTPKNLFSGSLSTPPEVAEAELNDIATKKASLQKAAEEKVTAYKLEHERKVKELQQAQAEAKAAAAKANAEKKAILDSASSSQNLGMFLSIPALGSINGNMEILAKASGVLGNSLDDLTTRVIPELHDSIRTGPTDLLSFQREVFQRLDAQDKAIKAINDQVKDLQAQIAALPPPPPPTTPSFTERDRNLLESIAATMICQGTGAASEGEIPSSPAEEQADEDDDGFINAEDASISGGEVQASTRAEVNKMSFTVTPLNPVTHPRNTITISSSEESFETSSDEDSDNSPPNLNDDQTYRKLKLKEVVSHLEKDAKTDALTAQQLAEEFVREDPEINADSIRAQQAALRAFENIRDQRELKSEEAESSWCLERINIRRKPTTITAVKLNKTRSKQNAPSYVRITVPREDDRDNTHSLRTLEDYELMECYELHRCSKK